MPIADAAAPDVMSFARSSLFAERSMAFIACKCADDHASAIILAGIDE